MANIVPTRCFSSADLVLTGGQHIKILIVNPDGTVAAVLIDDTCPQGQVLRGNTNYAGHFD